MSINSVLGSRCRVLACDDEPHTLRLIQACLQNRGCDVVKAANGIQALIRLRNERYDLLISDVMMPDMDGFELLQHIRRDRELENLPVIMLTAMARDRDVFEGYHHGADLYLTKPFNPGELVEFVQRINGR